MTPARVVVVGVGNEFRRDDGAGPRVVAALAGRLPVGTAAVVADGDPSRLIDAWNGAGAAFVVDACRGGRTPGTVLRVEVRDGGAERAPLPAWNGAGGSHALGLAAAVDLGRAVGRVPRHLVLFGIEGADFGDGPGLSRAVEAAAAMVARLVEAEVRATLAWLAREGA